MTTYDSGARSISGSSKRSRGVLLAGSLLAAASPAHALTVLTAAKVGHFDSGATQPPSAFVRVTNDAGLARLTDPRCPTGSRVAFSSASQSQIRTDSGETNLPCEHWRVSRRGFRYRDAAGSAAGVQEIVYERGRLRVRAGGPQLSAIAGPVIYVETFLGIGEQRYLVRFYDFRLNRPDRLVTRRASRAGAAGEAA